MPLTPTRRRLLDVLDSGPDWAGPEPPLLFVHGIAHEAGCWSTWMEAAAVEGRTSWAVSLRGHGRSGGSVRTARLSQYVDDVLSVLDDLPAPPVIVGHSLGGLIAQLVAAQREVAAMVLVAPVGHRPAVGSLAAIARQHPEDALRVLAGRTLPLRREYLFEQLSPQEADRLIAACGPESPIVQHQLVFHRPPGLPLAGPPVLTVAAKRDRLVPLRAVRATAARYDADLIVVDRIGHNLMQDVGQERVWQRIGQWLDQALRP